MDLEKNINNCQDLYFQLSDKIMTDVFITHTYICSTEFRIANETRTHYISFDKPTSLPVWKRNKRRLQLVPSQHSRQPPSADASVRRQKNNNR